MTCLVQVFVYDTNNGCSVRIGKTDDESVPLEENQCLYFEFVETVQEVDVMIKTIEKLSDQYRKKSEGIKKLQAYKKIRKVREKKLCIAPKQ